MRRHAAYAAPAAYATNPAMPGIAGNPNLAHILHIYGHDLGRFLWKTIL